MDAEETVAVYEKAVEATPCIYRRVSPHLGFLVQSIASENGFLAGYRRRVTALWVPFKQAPRHTKSLQYGQKLQRGLREDIVLNERLKESGKQSRAHQNFRRRQYCVGPPGRRRSKGLRNASEEKLAKYSRVVQ
ncbi:hypothetical protein EVAR_78548_1 [Eumeta japonica]|uniref:Uncharacterized protein n=1 Tax=Eumeta variegata TaxID=151549 RepID=A0A4C1W666_EUMVA|nr:hypothetical protein EVAR_78548_1 [Eumeta japonica]